MNLKELITANDIKGMAWSLLEIHLSEREKKSLAIENDHPYANDFELLEDYLLKHDISLFVQEHLGDSVNLLLPGKHDDTILGTAENLVQILEGLCRHFEVRIEARTNACKKAGIRLRMPALKKHLELTSKEQEAMACMLYASLGMNKKDNGGTHLSLLESRCKMSIDEIMRFLGGNRRHLKEQLVELPETKGIPTLTDRFSVSSELHRMMAGAFFSDRDLLRIEGTVLADILMEEGIRLSDRTDHGASDDDDENHVSSSTVSTSEQKRNLHDFLTLQKENENSPPAATSNLPSVQSREELRPYLNDREYIGDQLACLITDMEIRETTEQSFYPMIDEKTKAESLRELEGRKKIQRRRCRIRLEMTRKNGNWYPRLERLTESFHLCEFEKNVLLVLAGTVLMEEFSGFTRGSESAVIVKDLIRFFGSSLEEQLRLRRFFYRDATLVREGMITVDGGFARDVLEWGIDIDRKMLDHLVGLDVELSNLVDGSHLYTPTIRLSSVVLPEEQKNMVLQAIESYPDFVKNRKRYGLDDIIQYGRSIILLFHGPPGTGKTMLANALAASLGKKILLVNFPTLGPFNSDQLLAYLFREATVNDAILFFDECESILESRDTGNRDITQLLSAIERHEGTIIMATNRPFQLDKAMRRRFTMEVKFKLPGPGFREQIWQAHLPDTMPTAEDVDLQNLAMKYEFSGGFIKNAVLIALSRATSRCKDHPVITMEDLEHGARLQLRGQMSSGEYDRRIVPKTGLDGMILPPRLEEQLNQVIRYEKARNVLFGQWGFDEISSYGHGNGVLFHGPPGTGKTMAAEAIGYETGRPLLVVNMAELLSSYVGESAKNIESVFQEARQENCIPVFDEAEGLFATRSEGRTATERYANIDINILLHQIERFDGLVILTTNLLDNIDTAFFRRLKFILEFSLPNRKLRRRIWQKLIPPKAPLGDDVDFSSLADQYEFSGGNIKNCIYRAAARAAMRGTSRQRIEMSDFILAAGEEFSGDRQKRIGF